MRLANLVQSRLPGFFVIVGAEVAPISIQSAPAGHSAVPLDWNAGPLYALFRDSDVNTVLLRAT